MNKQKGFTLIELVAVIVLLGILSATALPRFMNLQGDARAGTLDAVAAAMQGAAVQTYAKALMQNEAGSTGQVTESTLTLDIGLVNGYPEASSATLSDIIDLMQLTGDFISSADGASATRLVGYDTTDNGTLETADNCYVTYTESGGSGAPPATVVTSDDC